MAIKLDDLVEGLAGAVVEAQSRIEKHQIDQFKSYFDSDGRPEKLDIRVPSLHPHAERFEEETYRVPLLPLVACSLLKIKEMQVEFDIDLVGLADDESNTPKDDSLGISIPSKKGIFLDLGGGGMLQKKNRSLHVILKLEGKELSEGMARVVERLITSQGAIRTDDDEEGDMQTDAEAEATHTGDEAE